MAIEFTIQEGRWSTNRLRAFLSTWAPRAPAPLLAQQRWQRTAGGLWTWFFAAGSVRGCSLLLEQSLMRARGVRVRLNLMASRVDWAVAHSLLRGLLEVGGGRVEGPGGRRLGAADLNDPAAGDEALGQLRADAESLAEGLRGGRPFAALPNPGFSLIVTEAMLPDAPDGMQFALALEEHLLAMAARYQAAAPCRVMTMPDGTTLAVWNLDAALLPLVHHVGIARGEDAQAGVVLPASTVIDALAGHIETVSEDQDRFYLPALDPARTQDGQLLDHLVAQGQPLAEWLARFPSQAG